MLYPKLNLSSLQDFIKTDFGKVLCPRCGNAMLDAHPALSRRMDVNICSGCGTEEALVDFGGRTDSDGIETWYAARLYNVLKKAEEEDQ